MWLLLSEYSLSCSQYSFANAVQVCALCLDYFTFMRYKYVVQLFDAYSCALVNGLYTLCFCIV